MSDARTAFSDEECFEALRWADAQSQEFLSAERYDDLVEDTGRPGLKAILARFSWNEAKALAGLDVVISLGGPPALSADKFKRDIQTVTEALGHQPSTREYEAYRNEHPGAALASSETIRRHRWGDASRGWLAALKHAVV